MTEKEAIAALKMENELMQFDPMTGKDNPIEFQNQDNKDLYEANLLAIEALEKQMNDRWIPCSEKYPDEEFDAAVRERGADAVYPVFATIKKRKPSGEEYITTGNAFYCGNRKGKRHFIDLKANELEVIAWRYPSEPYKGE